MKALVSRIEDLRGVLSPRTKVQAGPFTAYAGDMLNDHWSFERKYNPERGDECVLARNPQSNMVGISYLPFRHPRGRGDIVPPYLYFGADLIIKMDFYTRIQAPRMDLKPMDIGHPVAINHMEYEMVIYEANVVKDNPPQEMIIMPEDVPMLMNKILKLQEPRAKDILADQRKRRGLGELQMKAKILTFGKSA